MQDQQFLKRFLKLNEVSSDSTDNEITRLLTEAKWTEGEIQTALLLIRGKPYDMGVVAVTKRNTTLFRPDMNLSSDRLSSLLGVDVVIDPTKIRNTFTNEIVDKPKESVLMLWCIIIFLSVSLAIFMMWVLMFTMKFGPYQPAHSFF